MSVVRHEVRVGAYYDSIVLMQLQRALAALPGVEDAGVAMATPANRAVLATSGFAVQGVAAQPDDLLIVVRAASAEAAQAALGQVDALLQARPTGGDGGYRPRSLAAAVKQLPTADWVLISVPGRYAAAVADDALNLGKHVFLYSDNVSLDDEARLKQKAAARGLLVMGPDCGTAIVNGIGLGFANRVRRGPIGVVAASGTGLQAVTTYIHNLGGGVSHALGAGGRDLREAIGAATMRQGLRLLAADPQTRCIVLVSKPPSPAVAHALLSEALATPKPVVVQLIGAVSPARRLGTLWFANSLSDAAELAVERVREWESGRSGEAASDFSQSLNLSIPTHRPFLRGLFSGGTLAYEAVLTLQTFLAPLHTNTPVGRATALEDPLRSVGHTIVDLGEDDFTQGRLHPMLDNDLRLRRLREEAADPAVGLILLDVVLGDGAHPDPAAELGPAIAEVKRSRECAIVALVVGTDDDPQDRPAQIARLRAAGAQVFTDATACYAAVAAAFGRAASPSAPPIALAPHLAAVNVGLETFYDSLIAQGATAVHVDWRPPAGGNERMAALLARLKSG